MAFNGRQNTLISILQEQEIDTQFGLVEALKAKGYDVTQATVSRDIKTLGLVKVPGVTQKTKYAMQTSDKTSRLESMFRGSVLHIDTALNIIVIKTLTGSANAACALLDKLNFTHIVGTLAGDDTILVIVKDVQYVEEIYRKLKEFINN